MVRINTEAEAYENQNPSISYFTMGTTEIYTKRQCRYTQIYNPIYIDVSRQNVRLILVP